MTFTPRKRAQGTIAFPLSWAELEASSPPPTMTVAEATGVAWADRRPWRGYGEDAPPLTRRRLAAYTRGGSVSRSK